MPTSTADQRTSAEQLLAQLNWRYAVKKFDASRKIDGAHWSAIEEAMVLAPSSFGLQPWKFVTVANPALRAELQKVSWNQSQIVDASHLVVLASKVEVSKQDVLKFVDRIAEVRGGGMTPQLEGYRDMMVGSISNPAMLPGGSMAAYTRSQVYIALGFGLYTAAQLGIDACPMEGFDPAAYDKLLGLTEIGYHATVVATFGYRSTEDKQAGLKKVRFGRESVFVRR